MKRSTIILFLAWANALSAQQSEIKGVVSIHNSEFETGRRQYVQFAALEDEFERATSQTTDANGEFKLVFVGVPEKATAHLIVKKEGLELVNIDGLSAVTGQRDLVRLSMARPEKIAEYRRQIYKVGKTEAEKNLAAQLRKKGQQIEVLQKDAENNKTAIVQLQQEYGELQAFASKIEQQAQDLARRYAPVNLDDAAPLYRESFRLFQSGELNKALQVLRGANLVSQANGILAERESIANIRTEANQRDSIQQQRTTDLLQVLSLKADLHKARFEWDSVSVCLALRVNLDSSNVDNIWALANFFYYQNKLHEATTYYEKALVLAKTPALKATFLNNLGNAYYANQKMTQAEAAYNDALVIRRQLAIKNPDAFLPDVAATLNNLGAYYRTNQKTLQAEAAFDEALAIRRQLAAQNPDNFLPDVAATLNNLGLFYVESHKMPHAEAVYKEALAIRRQLAAKNPDANLPGVAATLNNLGIYHRANQQMPQAETVYREASEIYKQLAANNPDAFLPNVATTLNNLGLLYKAIQKIPQAEATYQEALEIYRQLAANNPDAFLRYVVATLNNLGLLHNANQNMPQAEAMLLEALDISRRLAANNADAFLPFIAGTLNNLGILYVDNQNMSQAEAAYTEALELKRQLAAKNPDAFLPDVAASLNNVGVFYADLKNYQQALVHYNEAMTLREGAILSGGVHFFKNWEQVSRNLNELKDSAEVRKEYVIVVQAGQRLAEGCDRLKEINDSLRPKAIELYAGISRWALFAKNYTLAESAAMRCLELDGSQTWVLANLGHSQLLRGQYGKAKFTYEKLKSEKEGEGNDYKARILQDFADLTEAGISHEAMARMRVVVETW